MRLFIGLTLNPALRREAAAYAEAFQAAMPGKYVEPGNYHITLAFIGEWEEGRLAEVKAAMDSAAVVCAPFALSLRGAGYFGKPAHAILHLVPRREAGMERAAQALREALSRAHIPFDPQPFNAHITLARNVNVARDLILPEPPSAEGIAHGMTLFHSTRVDDRLTYIPIAFSAFPALP